MRSSGSVAPLSEVLFDFADSSSYAKRQKEVIMFDDVSKLAYSSDSVVANSTSLFWINQRAHTGANDKIGIKPYVVPGRSQGTITRASFCSQVADIAQEIAEEPLAVKISGCSRHDSVRSLARAAGEDVQSN